MFLGGDFKTMHSHMEVVTENMVAGTSAKVFLQFWNCYVKKRFLSYDYGPRANLRIYGSVPARPRLTGQLSSGASACPPPAQLLARACASVLLETRTRALPASLFPHPAHTPCSTETPVDYMAHYHLIDIPIHFMAGLNDNLIPAKDCFKHYKVLGGRATYLTRDM